jgi:hypothetical protein
MREEFVRRYEVDSLMPGKFALGLSPIVILYFSAAKLS